MKKSLIICCAMILALLSGCSNESKGVPDELVLLDTELASEGVSEYEVIHDVNKELHTDNVMLVISKEGPYGRQENYECYTYQYDKSRDIWELIDEGDFGVLSVELNVDALISQSHWQGEYKRRSPTFAYSISILEMDSETGTARIRYDIDFFGDEEDLQGEMTVNLYADGGTTPDFEITSDAKGYISIYSGIVMYNGIRTVASK